MTAYLSNVSLDELDVGYYQKTIGELSLYDDKEERKIVEDTLKQAGSESLELSRMNSTAIVKGGRLEYYPFDMKIYTHTQNLEYPARVQMDYEYARTLFGLKDENLTVRRSLKIEDPEHNFTNVLMKEQYNLSVHESYNVLSRLKQFKQTLEEYESGELEKDSFYKVLRSEVFELEHRFQLLELTRKYKESQQE